MQRVVILGSTGSIGIQALEIIEANPDRFKVVGLAAGGKNTELLQAQGKKFGAKVGTGIEAANDLAAMDCEIVLNGISGSIGLKIGRAHV